MRQRETLVRHVERCELSHWHKDAMLLLKGYIPQQQPRKSGQKDLGPESTSALGRAVATLGRTVAVAMPTKYRTTPSSHIFNTT